MALSSAATRYAGWPFAFAGGAVILLSAAAVGTIVAAGNPGLLALAALSLGLVTIVIATAADWRAGVSLFLVWLLFEDLPRKFLGNNMLIYFGKDVLIGMTYAVFAIALRDRKVSLPRAAFLLPLGLFIGLGLLQVMNPNSPSLLYGLLGVKLYFYYVPLFFIGYALFRSQEELSRFLVMFAALGLVIAVLGIVQGIVGLDFLNPDVLAPELEALGRELRRAPISGRILPRATSVFVSEARQASFMLLAFVVNSGAAVFLASRGDRRVAIASAATVVAFIALLFHGSRAGILFAALTSVTLSITYATLAGYRGRMRHNVGILLATLLGLAAVLGGGLVALFPTHVAARWAFYTETLSPWSSASELGWRLWGYPTLNLRGAIESGVALIGQGIGTASLGTQYVQMAFRVPAPALRVESGYGTLAMELGALGPILWLVWTSVLVVSGIRIVRSLRGSPVFPVGAAILWFSFLLLFPLTFGALNAYQNFIYNAFFWLLVGVLFRLPALAAPEAATT